MAVPQYPLYLPMKTENSCASHWFHKIAKLRPNLKKIGGLSRTYEPLICRRPANDTSTFIYLFIHLLSSSDKTMDLVKEENGEAIDIDENCLPSSVSNIEGVKTIR